MKKEHSIFFPLQQLSKNACCESLTHPIPDSWQFCFVNKIFLKILDFNEK